MGLGFHCGWFESCFCLKWREMGRCAEKVEFILTSIATVGVSTIG